jgi:hypothetical protein
MLLNITVTAPSDVERGMVSAWARLVARLVPKIETKEPGATPWLVAKLAAFSTPPDATTGVWANTVAAQARVSRAIKVSFILLLLLSILSASVA